MTAEAVLPRAEADATADAAPTDQPSAEQLLTALRALFTCTRKMRSWVSGASAMTVLGVVAEAGEARVSSLASTLLMDVSTVSRQLTALCRDGLVQWRADENDLRSHLVSCTPAGLDRLNERRAQLSEELTARLQSWPESDVNELSRLLNHFVSSVLVDPAAPPTSSVPPASVRSSKESA
jgi:DNA-binding MarR family transcriptional regulator